MVDTERVVDAEPPDGTTTFDVARVAVIPGGPVDDDRVTVPENPLTLVTVMVSLEEPPAMIVRLPGVANIVKSGFGGDGRVTVTVVEWLSDPPVPLTVAV